MTPRPPKTNVLRLLDEAGIRYEVMTYSLEDAEFSAEAVASQLGLPEDQVFKTLLTVGEHGPTFGVVAAGSDLDLKALARVRGEARMSMAPLRDVVQMTGYTRGAVTVLGARRVYPVVLDEIALVHDQIAVSAGAKGVQVMLATEAYRTLTNAILADVSH